ncbi:hypothetical protein PSY53_23695, partial [Shigella flexneri]|nr:hypothetical protein [Shigella flexneri]
MVIFTTGTSSHGPLMGFTLPWLDVPVVKITNCLLAPSANELGRGSQQTVGNLYDRDIQPW